MSTPERSVLIAVTGLSPAIVTETVWALAKTYQIIPDGVILITTSEGKKHLERELFTPSPEFGGLSVWEALREELQVPQNKLTVSALRIMESKPTPNAPAPDLSDIRSDEENSAAADYILSQVREAIRSSDKLIASIAGGRKTMGTLLYAAMSLVARPNDLITHVLVNPPFDGRLHPNFFFPASKPQQHEKRSFDGKTVLSTHCSKDAEIQLARIPFVPLGNRFKDLSDDEQPDTFGEAVARMARQEVQGEKYVARLAFDKSRKTLIFDERNWVEMENPEQLLLFEWICQIQVEPWAPKSGEIMDFGSATELCKAWHGVKPTEGQMKKHQKEKLAQLNIAKAPRIAPYWLDKLEPRSFTKTFARIRNKLPATHPWATLPETTLWLPPFKVVQPR